MTNEEAIRHLEDLQRLYLGNEKFTADIEAIGIAIEALKKSEWISCSERLPEEAGLYLVSMHRLGYPQREIDGFVRGKWERYGNNVIAWMPLPKPYKAESEEES